MTYILRSSMSGGFWTGSALSDEYPDAELFTTKKAAIVAAKKAAATDYVVEPIDVIVNYGMDDERVIMQVRA